MKMGTTASLWRYDAIAGDTLHLASLGCSAIQHCASWIPTLPNKIGGRLISHLQGFFGVSLSGKPSRMLQELLET
jgi:hypothetical protein